MINAIYFYRVSRFFYRIKLTWLSWLIDLLIFLIYNSRIPYQCQIGKGSYFSYGGIGVVIHKRAIIGRNCIIGTNVTIGGRSGEYNVPIIGNNCEISTGSKILGPIVLGHDIVVGANAVVINSFESKSVIAGIPARLIKNSIVK